MQELSPRQIATLEKLPSKGFQIVSFPMYSNYIGVKRGNCAALLTADAGGGLRLYGEPCYLVDSQFSVRVVRGAQHVFVWKKKELAVTPEREVELDNFRRELLENISGE